MPPKSEFQLLREPGGISFSRSEAGLTGDNDAGADVRFPNLPYAFCGTAFGVSDKV